MKADKKQQLQELRKQQANELKVKTMVLKSIKAAHQEHIKRNSEYTGSSFWYTNIKAMNQLESDVKRLELELLEKKYANNSIGTDCEPYEVIEEVTADIYKIRSMSSTMKKEAKKELNESFSPGGFCGHFDNSLQEWTITPDPAGAIYTIRRHKDGYFYTPGGGRRFWIGATPVKKYDYNF